MSRFEVTWVSYAEAQYQSLPHDVQRAVDRHIARLTTDPERNATYDAKTDRWTSSFEHGLITYLVHSAVLRITLLRITALGVG